jgi:hypothetical protein
MARTRGPANLVSHAPRTDARTETPARADYESMIAHDLGGRRQNSYRAIDDGRPVGAAELLLRPISLFLLACTAFVIVLALWLWQAGVFGQLQLSYAQRSPVPSSSWMGTRQPRSMQPLDTSPTTPSTGPNGLKAVPADAAASGDGASPPADDGAGANTAN